MVASAASSAVTNGSIGIVTNPADVLPQETALHVLDFLDAVSLSKCAETYSAWRKLASTDLLWQRRCKSDFGIDGGKADYASRWQQERRRALANLELYIGFLDEIYFALAGFFALVSIFAVFPVLVVLKIDGWLAISWTQVFGCIYGLGFVAVMFVLVRITLLATMFSPSSTLTSCMTYGGAIEVARRVLANHDVARKSGGLVIATGAIGAIPFALHLFADGYLETPQLAALLVWTCTVVVAQCTRRLAKSKRSAVIDTTSKCAVAATSLLLAKATVATWLPWCVPLCLLAAPPLFGATPTHFRQIVCKRIYGRFGSSTATLRRVSPTDAASFYYQHCPPLVSLGMIGLKLDGVIDWLPWALVLVDYAAWAIHGPLALHARQLVQLMFREMPIPAAVRKL